jgi:DNA segregation ATPase FtsK/SpoIIIE, S-DNA-T family
MNSPDAQTEREQLARAAEVVVQSQFGSPSMVQRKLHVTFAAADRLMTELERYEVVRRVTGSLTREVMVKPDELGEVLDQIRGGA